MTTKNPRIQVSLSEDDLAIINIICKNKKISMSSLVRKVVEDWLEDYEDTLLAKKAEEAEKQWEKKGRKTISHEDLCKELGLQ